MYIRVKDRTNGKKSIQIVETFRRGNSVHQKILRHVGQAVNDREVEVLKNLAESIMIEYKNQRDPVLPGYDPAEIYKAKVKAQAEVSEEEIIKIKNLKEVQRINEGISDIFGKLYSEIELDQVLGSGEKNLKWNEILKATVLARISNPVSKKATASLLEEDFGIKIPLENIYRMMDVLAEKESKVKQKISDSTLSLFKQKVDVLFFDVTTLYFESTNTDEIREFGFSKDCKFKESQVTLALVTTTAGLPVTYQLFPGNMYEGHTLIKIVEELKKNYQVTNTLLVADRAMFTRENLDFMDQNGIQYIVAAKLKTMSKALRSQITEDNDFSTKIVENELHWIKEYEYESRRLIVSYNSKRAEKDAKDRSRLIERLMKKTRDGKVKISEIIPNYGSKKYLKLNGKEAAVNEEKISEDAMWDGVHGVITNSKTDDSTEILSRYRGLWQIEEAFRISKHDLKFRPVYHWNPERVKAHILICYISLALVKQAVYRMKVQKQPMSFEQLRNELLHVQASIIEDKSTKRMYLLPSHVTTNQKNIYRVFGLKRSETPKYFK